MLTITALKKEKVQAFKTGLKLKSKLIGLLVSELQVKEKDGEVIGEQDILAQIFSMNKQIRANITVCEKISRMEDKAAYQEELSYFNDLLKLASVEMLEDADIDELIEKLGVTDQKGMGKLMGYLGKNHAGEYDPSGVAAHVQAKFL